MPEPEPAFGQVWEWGPSGGTPFNMPLMLIHSMFNNFGDWIVVSLVDDDEDHFPFSMSGLHDDPEKRIEGWRCLSD